MFVEAVQNNGKTYLRLVESVRIRNKDGYKVSSKKVIMNIGPLSRFNDGQPDYVERLKKSFKAGNPLIPSLLPYCSENKAIETYRLSINEGSPDCFGHPKMFCQVLLEKILEELGLNTFFASYPNRCHAASQAWLFYYQKRSDFYSQQVLIHRLGGRFLMYQADMKASEKPLANIPTNAKICMEPIIRPASDPFTFFRLMDIKMSARKMKCLCHKELRFFARIFKLSFSFPWQDPICQEGNRMTQIMKGDFTMKKIIAFLIAMIMILSTTAVFAEGNPPSGGPGGTQPSGEMGTPPDGMGGGPGGTPPEGQSGGFGGSTPPGGQSSSFDYTGATEITSAAEIAEEAYASETVDESALIVNTADAVSLDRITVTKTGDSNGGDNCNFYGLNAALLVMGGSTTTITGANVSSSADGANGVFSYGGNGGQNGAAGDGTTVYISDSTITTTGDGSGGIMTTGGGVTYATNLTVETSGRSSAAIRTDRGGGTVVVDGGTYTSNGLGSPAIYSTADITVSSAALISNLSEGVCIEGKNSIALVNCDLTANNTQCNGNATFLDTIMIYQSMSGDADSGTSAFTMTGGSLTSKSGHIFHVTNTNAVITLSGVTLVNEGSDVLISVCDDGWSGASNIATLNASNQALAGTILVGSDSTLNLNLTEGSSFEGTVSGEITNAKGAVISTEVGTVNVALDATSIWTLTADTYITSFDGNMENVISNGYTLYVNGNAVL